MDHVSNILPHVIWAVAAFASVRLVVGRRSDVKRVDNFVERVEALTSDFIAGGDTLASMSKELERLKTRMEKLETPSPRKQVF